jgi:hypothetical protein
MAGVLVGVAALLRGHAVLLLLVGWLAWGFDSRFRRRAVIFTVATVLVLIPLLAYNGLRAGRLVGLSCNGGLNLYIGNGPEADGFYVSFAGFDFESDPAGVSFLTARLGRPVEGVAEADRIWAGAAWDTIRERPWRAVQLWLKKIWLHFVGWEISQVTPQAAWARDGPLLRVLLVPYDFIAVAGLLGFTATRWRNRRLRVWAVALAVLVAVQSLFFVVSRYRLVIVPILCLLGAYGLTDLITRRRWRLAVSVLVVLGAVLVTRPWGLGPVRANWDGLSACNEAVRWEWLGDEPALGRAAELYQEALVTDPTQIVAYRNLARVRVRQGRHAEAEEILARGVLRVPRSEFIEADLIHLLLEQNRVEAAVPRLAAYLRDHPPQADILHNYAVALSRTDRPEAALTVARDLVTLAPHDPRGYIDLGVLLARAGRIAEARAAFTAGLERNPGHEGLLHNLQLLPDDEP